jgi:phenylalanyl-tRNA synthetase alpha chain
MTLEQKLSDIEAKVQAAMDSASTTAILYEVKVQFLGKTGEIASLMKNLADLPKEDRPRFGKLVNEVKVRLESEYEAKNEQLKATEMAAKIRSQKLDLTLPGPVRSLGAVHPIARMQDEVIDLLTRVGFSVRLGPQIEKDWYNFEALNFPQDHPSRDLQDTFYIEDQFAEGQSKDRYVLRTHTSPVQVRVMESEKPPIRILAPGSVFRCDSDLTHSPNFHQIEGLLIDRKVSMSDLKGTISYFIRELFGKDMKVRFRPSFFPFTEPSAEFDGSCFSCKGQGCRLCKQSGWIEIGGCGLVHPRVLQSAGLNPKEWQGYAFGFGLERMAILRYGIEDIRLFFDNNLQFLGQFTS